MSALVSRIAAAPISWGVCEVPGWGHQLSRDLVLRQMRDVGLAATEFGPEGFLPKAPTERAEVLAQYGLSAVGGFVPVVLHDAATDPLPQVDDELEAFSAAGARTLVLAAATGLAGYDERPALDDESWHVLLSNLDRLVTHAADRGVLATLHPHVGTMVERREEVLRVLECSSAPLCLDTGHLLVGGTDPGELVEAFADRIAHAHLKDVDMSLAEQVRSGTATYAEAVRAGLYRALGQGDVDIAAIVTRLERSGYEGWYVMEQDTVLDDESQADDALADVRASIDFLRGLGA